MVIAKTLGRELVLPNFTAHKYCFVLLDFVRFLLFQVPWSLQSP